MMPEHRSRPHPNSPCPETAAADKPDRLLKAAEHLLPWFEQGAQIEQSNLREAMEEAFGASDTSGAWVWKDAYDACEAAQVMMLTKFGSAMLRQAKSPAALIGLFDRIANLAPSHTRRSESSQKLQQFSTPLPLAAVVAVAAQIKAGDIVLEPSAGTGLLAVHAALAGAGLHLNELDSLRADLLSLLFPKSLVTRHDAGTIHDRLDPSCVPSVILMNPPFSAAPGVEGRYKGAVGDHVLAALSRLADGGRLVLISGANFSPSTSSFRKTFERISDMGTIRFSAPIAGRVYARHGTTTDTRFTIIDKITRTDPDDGARTWPEVESARALLACLQAHCPDRPISGADTNIGEDIQSQPARSGVSELLRQAQSSARADAAERAKHPFDRTETEAVSFAGKVWTEPKEGLTTSLYEGYKVQSIEIEGPRNIRRPWCNQQRWPPLRHRSRATNPSSPLTCARKGSCQMLSWKA